MAASKRKGLDLKTYIRDIPDFPKPGILFPVRSRPQAGQASVEDA